MDPTTNPYAPGAGTEPPELAGRDKILHDAKVALARGRIGRPAKSQLLLGLRGVGKTVLLNRIADMAEAGGYLTVQIEAPERRSLPELLVPPLRSLLLKLSRKQRLQDTGRRALRALQSFAGTFKVSFHDLELGVDAASGTADSGVLEADLPEVLLLVAEAAKDGDAAVAITIDEMQYLTAEALAALIVAAHKVAQKQLPLLLFGAGLPQLAALAGDAKSYAERLFDFPPVEALTPAEARDALREPARREGVDYDNEALALIVEQTRGYPYFLQEWGSSAWNVAPGSPITAADANRATELAVAQLDSGFFRVRFDRLTPREKDYMRAMAGLGPGPHRSGDIAQALNQGVASVAPLRQALITKGMIYSPAHGDTAFTVPMFDEFLRRTVPDWRPRAAAPNPAS